MIGWWVGLGFLPGKLGQSLLWGTSQSPHYNMNSAVNVTVDHRTAVVRSLPDRTSQQVDQSQLTPTTLEVSRGTHILEVVHVNDINNGGYNPGPVLGRDKGRKEYLLRPQQSKSHHPNRPSH